MSPLGVLEPRRRRRGQHRALNGSLPEADTQIDDRYTIGVVLRTFDLLRCMTSAPPPWRLNEVAAISGLSKATAFRYLRSLQKCGVISHEESSGVYRIEPSALVS